jgi:hypothetical protein
MQSSIAFGFGTPSRKPMEARTLMMIDDADQVKCFHVMEVINQPAIIAG